MQNTVLCFLKQRVIFFDYYYLMMMIDRWSQVTERLLHQLKSKKLNVREVWTFDRHTHLQFVHIFFILFFFSYSLHYQTMTTAHIPTFKLVLGAYTAGFYLYWWILRLTRTDLPTLPWCSPSTSTFDVSCHPHFFDIQNTRKSFTVGDGGTGKTTFVKVCMLLLISISSLHPLLDRVWIELIITFTASFDWWIRKKVHR